MPSLKIIGLLVLEKKIFKVFTIYGHGGHLGHVTWTICINFLFPLPRMLQLKFGFDWPSGFRGEDVYNCEWTTTDNGYPFGSGELIKNFQ